MTEEKNVEEIEERQIEAGKKLIGSEMFAEILNRLKQIEHNQNILAKNQKRMNATLMEIFNK